MKKLLIFGNLGRDPKLLTDSNGNKFATFVVAVEGNKKHESKLEWVEVSCTGKLANAVIKLARKGSRIFAEGYPAINAFINDTDEIITIQRLYAHSIEILNRQE